MSPHKAYVTTQQIAGYVMCHIIIT